MPVARGTFRITMTPGPPELAGTAARFEFAKTFDGDLVGDARGVFLSVGDPGRGEAGYVALERVEGRVEDRSGSFVLAQLGTMHGGAQDLRYLVVPGSGVDALTGISGTLALTIDSDGTHHYALDYAIDPATGAATDDGDPATGAEPAPADVP